jgi:hypothetical protein
VKRSVTLRNDVDADIQRLAGRRGYSAFLNDAAILALQSQAVDEWLRGYDERNDPLTPADEAWARERLATARSGARP